MRFAISRWLILLLAATCLGAPAAYGQEPLEAPPVHTVSAFSEPLEAPPVHRASQVSEPLEAPPVSLDAFAGRTVKDQSAGYGIIKARAKHLPKVGTPAPDFELKTADGSARVKLSSFRGKQPVVLIFGSVT